MLGPSRILGLGGAYGGVAEGIDGATSNVAAPAVRATYSGLHVDYDLTASITFPGSFSSTDFENRGSLPRGSANASDFVYGNAGALVQVGPFGAALTLDATSYTLESPNQNTINFRLLRAHAIVAWAFLKYQLVVGVGIQGVTMNLASSAIPLAPPSGVGPEAGVLLKLDDQPWRLGVTARAPVSGGVSGDQTALSGKILPSSVVAPGEIEIGFALQLGPRPLNPRWIDPSGELAPLREKVEAARDARKKTDDAEVAKLPAGAPREALQRKLEARERAIRRVEDQRLDTEEKRIREEHDARFANWPRPRLLVVADALITAPVSNAVAVSSFLDQTNESYGASWTVSPRLGLEGEPFPDRFRLRFGSYLEPSLFDGGSARQHFTFGGDLKLFTWDFFGILERTTWQLSAAADLAPRYSNWGLSLGVWH
ncbi:MAG TPA: hypothetical protein VGH28_07890 [Polyangiaceae bacterium]